MGWAGLLAGGVLIVALVVPLAPINSPWWDLASSANGDIKEEIGWPELTASVAQIYNGLPAAEKAQAGIFTNNYGEAGALNMYGPALGLPTALSGVNSYWLRGHDSPPLQTLIVVGYLRADIAPYFESCELAGQIPNPYHLDNEESHVPDIFVCRGLRESWEQFWADIRHFG